MLACGAKVLAGLLTEQGSGRREEEVLCRCGQRMESQGVRGKELMTILGPVAYERSRFSCPDCGASRYPGDEALDVVGTTRSPGLRRMMARAGSQATFKDGRDDLRIYAGRDLPKDPDLRKSAMSKIRYLDKNKKRMRYNTFRAQGLFVGSGVVEAGCKTVIGQRLK